MTFHVKVRATGAVAGAIAAAFLAVAPRVPTAHAEGAKLTLEQRVQRLEDEATIRQKLESYMELLQASDWDNYIKMFAKNAKLVMNEGVRQGRDDIKERMSTASARMAKAREGKPKLQRADLLSNIEVHVTGPDTADARARFTFLAEQPDHTFTVQGSGIYTDKWVREDGEWKIGYRAVHWDLLRGQSAEAASKEHALAYGPQKY
jgi:3-phenylpropionate/cinnamic acid dioxygenase small subunit